jgi:transcriptional regulator with XRE-family HTH domain
VRSRDLIRIARDRSGLSQEQLAARIGKPRSTIARWESGARTPSLESLQEVIDAAGLDLVISLAIADPSLEELVKDQLALAPLRRLGSLLPAAEVGAVEEGLALVAEMETPAIVVGPVAAVLSGAPQRPREATVEVVAGDRERFLHELEGRGAKPTDDEDRFNDVNRRWRWDLAGGGAIAVVDRLVGAAGYRDLQRSAIDLQIGRHRLAVAAPRDLLRLAEASPDEQDRAYLPGLRALLKLAPDGDGSQSGPATPKSARI